jgi:hypothetical protein
MRSGETLPTNWTRGGVQNLKNQDRTHVEQAHVGQLFVAKDRRKGFAASDPLREDKPDNDQIKPFGIAEIRRKQGAGTAIQGREGSNKQ